MECLKIEKNHENTHLNITFFFLVHIIDLSLFLFLHIFLYILHLQFVNHMIPPRHGESVDLNSEQSIVKNKYVHT
jgi:hypothetical protein